MKKIVLIIVILAGLLKANAQQDLMVSQYMFNGLFLNPAYAGSHKYFSSTVLHREQWVNFDGAPQTSLLAVDGPLKNGKMGLGFMLSHDKIGVTSQTDFYGNYAYFLKLANGKLGLGIKAGVSNYIANVGNLTVWDENDQVFAGTKKSAWLPKFGFGIYYYTARWYAGVAIPTLVVYDPEHNFNLSVEHSSAIRKHYFYNAGYVFKISEQFKVKPSFLVKYTSAAPWQTDICCSAIFFDQFSLGLTYRSNDAVSVILEYQANQRFRIGYAYDFTTSKVKSYAAGTHEIMLGFDFGKDIIKTKTPRFF